MKTARFYTTDRNKLKALWVQVEGQRPLNIWDVSEKELTKDVELAIISAFQRGCEAKEEEDIRAVRNSIIPELFFSVE